MRGLVRMLGVANMIAVWLDALAEGDQFRVAGRSTATIGVR